MISFSASFILFIIAMSLIILLAMRFIFVTKTELEKEMIAFKNDILKNFDNRMTSFTDEVQGFINKSIKQKIDNLDSKIDKIVELMLINDKK
jgi:peptidoglycan hydrolase CwlO-like protein